MGSDKSFTERPIRSGTPVLAALWHGRWERRELVKLTNSSVTFNPPVRVQVGIRLLFMPKHDLAYQIPASGHRKSHREQCSHKLAVKSAPELLCLLPIAVV